MAKLKPIHARVRDHVDAAGLTIADIARRTKWNEMRVWRLLTGRTELGAEDMEVLAKVLEKPVADLYRGIAARASS